MFRQIYKDFELIIVDNASTDGSVELIKKNFTMAKVIVNKKNLGYTGAVNVGVKHSKGEYIAILSDDTKVDKRWLIEMLNMLKGEKSTAIVGCNIKNISGFYNKNTFGTFISLLGDPIDVGSKDKTLTFLASGCSLLFKKRIIGIPFDDEYFAYSEDLYMAWLTRLKGYNVKIAPNSKLIHYGYGTSVKIPRQVDFHKEKNKITNLLLFYEKKTLIKIAPLFFFYIILNLIFSLFTGKFAIRIKSYMWLIANWKKLMLKRKKIQKQRKVPDREIFKYMTYNVQYGLGAFDKLISKLLYLYCIIFNLKVYESENKNKF